MILQNDTRAEFPPTHWTLIEALRNGSEQERAKALQQLIELYWPPVYAWFRRFGKTPDDAAECAQGFFASRVLHSHLFESADRTRGKLRTLTKTALRNYSTDLHRRRGREVPTISEACLIEVERQVASSRVSEPDELLDEIWARTVLEEALRRCEEHQRNLGRPDYWRAFEARIVRPIIAGAEPQPLDTLAEELGFSSAAAVAVVVHTVKDRCQRFIRQVIAESAGSPEAAEEEFNSLFGGSI